MLELIKYQLEQENINFRDKKYLLGVSGGIDSMVLLSIFNQLSLNISVAHINYKLRGNDSDLDEEVVRNYCYSNKLNFYLKSVDYQKDITRGNIQENARRIRYDYFDELMQETEQDYIVLAHHHDDQIETILLNVLRGVGPKLMKFRDGDLLRPLLSTKKSDIIDFAKLHSIPYREDGSNKENYYNRNLLRNKIIPQLQGAFRHMDEKVLAFSKRYWKDQNLISQLLSKNEINKTENILNGRHLFHLSKPFGFSYPQCRELFDKGLSNGIKLQSKSHILLIDKDLLLFYDINSLNSPALSLMSVDKLPINQVFNDYNLKLEIVDFNESLNELESNLDLKKLKFPLGIRSWNKGDRINVSRGRINHKKLKKIFNDAKYNYVEKRQSPILTDADNNVIAIIGLKTDPNYISNDGLVLNINWKKSI